MGSNPHSRVVELWRPAPRWSTQARPGAPWIEHKGRRKRLTPAEAWQDVYDQEGYEDGHSYSGSFGSKGGMVVVATVAGIDKDLHALDDLMAWFAPGEADWLSDPFKVPRGKNANQWEVERTRKMLPARKRLLARLGEATLRRAAALYDDKWGPAVAIVGKDHVWFGGYCSS